MLLPPLPCGICPAGDKSCWEVPFPLCFLLHCTAGYGSSEAAFQLSPAVTGTVVLCWTVPVPPQEAVTVTYCHHAIEEPRLGLGGRLQPLHGPLVHHGRHVRVLNVEQPKARHVHPAVPVGLQVQRKQVLEHQQEHKRNHS